MNSIVYYETGSGRLGEQLYWASHDGLVEEVWRLLEQGAPVNWRGPHGWTPLMEACVNKKVAALRILLKYKPDVNLQNEDLGDTAVHRVCQQGSVECLRLLVATGQCDLGIINMYGRTPLGDAVYYEKLNVVKYLIIDCNVDIHDPINELGDSSLGLAVKQCGLTTVKFLVTECNAKPDGSHLILALKGCSISKSRQQPLETVRYLLKECHCDPNVKDEDGQTPLALAQDKETIQLLLQHGAIAEDVYTEHRKMLGKKFSKDPLKSPVKVFVIGHGSEGKSTLIEALEQEPSRFAPLLNFFVKPKEVKGVDRRTAGIIPRTFISRFYGKVQFFDFAGQEAYYSSHAAVIKSAVNTSSPIFLLVVGLHRGDTTVTQSVSYWLGIIANQCGNLEGRAPLIVVCSHTDVVTNQAEVDQKKQIIFQAVKRFRIFDIVEIISLDCRFSNSNGIKTLRHSIGVSCDSVRAKLAVSLNSHMFLIYLLDNYLNEVAITLEKLEKKIKLDVTSQNISKKHKKTLTFIPTTIPRLVEICIQLSDKGHILFLHNTSSPNKSFVIINKTKLLGKINGTMFAPEDFKQHCKIATSTGIVPRSKLATNFPEINASLLIGFLSYLELAVPIEDNEILSLIDLHLSSTDTASCENGFVFCPALIKLSAPIEVFKFRSDCNYHFGLSLSCVGGDDFFNARLLHVLILRLALTFGLAPELTQDIPAIQRRCSVWTTGVCWCTPQGVRILVEVVIKKTVIILIQAHRFSSEPLILRSTVIQKVLEAAKEFCPSVTLREFVIPPNAVSYPVNLSDESPSFSLKSVALRVINQEPCVVSVDGSEILPVIDLLQAEVYANLGENILQLLFNENDPAHNTIISNRFLSALSSSWSKNPKLVDIICSAIAKEIKTTPDSCDNLVSVLKLWRDAANASYKELRQILDPLSVFAGMSPLSLAGIPEKEFSIDLLPETNQSTSSDCAVMDALKKEYNVSDPQLNTEVTIVREDLHILAGFFDNYSDYLDKLELSPPECADIRAVEYREKSHQSAIREALRLWIQHNTGAATFRALLTIVIALGKTDTAVSICKFIAENVVKPKHQH